MKDTTHKTTLLNTVLTDQDKDRIIQMAWEDRTPFEAITFQFGLREKDVIEFMRKNSLPSSFRMWRKRMKSRITKHSALRDQSTLRFKCSMQRDTGNKIAKR
ncbi:MAG: TIGR03643 family protein [Bacteroidetes bacterium B1(2017)]|nr:MAG: TIGR03643 family protein [Bacteroidetes bacterium B1(2017)]